MADHSSLKGVGGLNGVTIERLHMKDHINALEQRRFPLPRFLPRLRQKTMSEV